MAWNFEAGNIKAGNFKAGNFKTGNLKTGNFKAGNFLARNCIVGNVLREYAPHCPLLYRYHGLLARRHRSARVRTRIPSLRRQIYIASFQAIKPLLYFNVLCLMLFHVTMHSCEDIVLYEYAHGFHLLGAKYRYIFRHIKQLNQVINII